MSFRLKLARGNNLNIRVATRIPAQLVGGDGIEIVKTDGVFTFNLDYGTLVETAAIAPALEDTTYVSLWESIGDDFSRINITNLKADFADTFGGLFQPLDATLTALAALDSTAGLLTQTGADTFERRSLAAPAAGFTITNPAGTAGNPTFVLANDLAAYEGLSTNGLVARTGDGIATTRTLTAPAAGITVTNGGGVAGNPTLVLANDLAALEGLGSTGFAARTTTDTWAQRALTAPAAGFTITNPAGVAGNPTFVLANDLAAYEGLSANGLVARTGDGTASARTLTAPAAGITVSNGDGVAGNPTLVLANDLAALEGLASTGIARRTGSDAWSVGTAVSNAELAAMAAFTFKGNNTSGSATPTDVDIAALTTKASPAAGDYVILSDQAASGAWKKSTVSSISAAGSVSSIAGNTGAFTLGVGLTNSTNDIQVESNIYARTLASPVTLTTQTAVTFGSIPAGTFKIEMMFANVSQNATDVPILFLGDAGGLEGTGYSGATVGTTTGGTTVSNQWSTAVNLATSLGAGSNFSGGVTMDLLDTSTNTWSIKVHNALGDAQFSMIGAGSKSTSAVLTQIQLNTVLGTTQFDAGKVNVSYWHPAT